MEHYSTYAYEILDRHRCDTAKAYDLILLPHARLTVRTLLDDACAGKWSCVLRSDVEILLTLAEREACETKIVRRFVSGCDEESPPDVLPTEDIAPSCLPAGFQAPLLLHL